MASSMWGLNVGEVNTLSSKLSTEATNIQTIITTLSGQLNQTSWEGPDAEKFRSDWNTTHVKQLQQVAQGLTDAALAAKTNAQAQSDVSSH